MKQISNFNESKAKEQAANSVITSIISQSLSLLNRCTFLIIPRFPIGTPKLVSFTEAEANAQKNKSQKVFVKHLLRFFKLAEVHLKNLGLLS